jgi:hypothetical protein
MKDHEEKPKEVEATAAPEAQAEQPKKKRPYVKPSFQFEKVFETNALACGKVGVTQETCRSNRKAS